MLSFRYNALIIAFWLATMSWLVVAKVLPPLLNGRAAQLADDCLCRGKSRQDDNGGRVGYLRSISERSAPRNSSLHPMQDDVKELRSEVHFSGTAAGEHQPLAAGSLCADARRSAAQCRRSGPRRHSKSIRWDGCWDSNRPWNWICCPSRFTCRATSTRTQLRLTLRSGDFVYRTESFLPHDSLLTDALVAAIALPGLKVGSNLARPLVQSVSPAHASTGSARGGRRRRGTAVLARPSSSKPWSCVYYNEQGGRLGGDEGLARQNVGSQGWCRAATRSSAVELRIAIRPPSRGRSKTRGHARRDDAEPAVEPRDSTSPPTAEPTRRLPREQSPHDRIR